MSDNASPTVLFISIEPKTKADENNLERGLQALAAEDPTFRFQADQQAGQVAIAGVDELHLEIILDRLRREFGVDASVGRPRVAYKERVTVSADGDTRFVRTTGGRSQFGAAKIRVIPLAPGTGYQFENAIKGNAIPHEYIKLIDQGIQEALARGILAGYPIDDVGVQLHDVSYHEVHSPELVFRIVGSLALQDAAKKAKPILLEPVMRLEVSVPKDDAEKVVGNLRIRRGEILSQDSRGAMQLIQARVPLSDILGYATNLRSRTLGRATCSMHFDRYQPRSPESSEGPDDPLVA
jgi:elongation factor G